MPWNYMQIELIPADMRADPTIGPGELTREQALAEIQSILDRSAPLSREFAATAETWRRGAKDDTVYLGPFSWTVYEYEHGDDPRRGALVWLEDYANIMRAAGLTNIGIAKLPD